MHKVKKDIVLKSLCKKFNCILLASNFLTNSNCPLFYFPYFQYIIFSEDSNTLTYSLNVLTIIKRRGTKEGEIYNKMHKQEKLSLGAKSLINLETRKEGRKIWGYNALARDGLYQKLCVSQNKKVMM